jgi:uncharacterized protein YgiM (DUF1202 family)
MKLLAGVIASVTMMFLNSAALIGAEVKAPEVAAKAITDGLIVRQAPDDKSPTVATLKKGDAVTASDRKGAYWKVKLADGKEGFVSVTGLQTKAGVGTVKDAVTGALPTPAPAAAPVASPVDTAKAAAAAKVDEAKAKKDAAAKKQHDSNAQKMEKAANKLFKK